jgi:TetR/AcrR family transcriptional regulator
MGDLETPRTDLGRGSWERARRPYQVAERREAILLAASRLVDEAGIEGAGLSAIAREVGLSKANLYRYFESREAVLLALLKDEMVSWAEGVRARVEAMGKVTAFTLAQTLALSYEGRERYCALFSSLASVLEQNLGAETIRAFKSDSMQLIGDIVALLERRVPEIEPAVWIEFLLQHAMYLAGLWPHCYPSETVRSVLDDDQFAVLRFNFAESIQRQSECYLKGIGLD